MGRYLPNSFQAIRYPLGASVKLDCVSTEPEFEFPGCPTCGEWCGKGLTVECANLSTYVHFSVLIALAALPQRHELEGNPQHWRIHGKKLYLFHTSAGARRFSKDPAGTIKKAQAYWDRLGVKE